MNKALLGRGEDSPQKDFFENKDSSPHHEAYPPYGYGGYGGYGLGYGYGHYWGKKDSPLAVKYGAYLGKKVLSPAVKSKDLTGKRVKCRCSIYSNSSLQVICLNAKLVFQA